MMRINWVLGKDFVLPEPLTIDQIKATGPSWGAWATWRSCGTDNVICNDLAKAQDLIRNASHAVCNLYVPKKWYSELGRPTGLHLFEGEYHEQVIDLDAIVAMHLAGSNSDIVLLAGHNWGQPTQFDQPNHKHRYQNQIGLAAQAIKLNSHTQWVVLDHPEPLHKSISVLDNITCDKLQNVLNLLS